MDRSTEQRLERAHMNPEELTAVHESGHARVGHEIVFGSVQSVRIFEVAGAWEGEADINLEGMDVVQRTAIAIAGVLAEARAKAMAIEATRRIRFGDRLTDELGRAIGIAVANRLAVVPMSIPVTPFDGVERMPANLTLEDIDFIPDEVADNLEAIHAAAALACSIINHHGEIAVIFHVASRLIEIQPEAITNYVTIIGGLAEH